MDTTAVQRALVALGYSLVVDGVAGPKTKAVVKAFQISHGLHVDGIVGPRTEAALMAAIAVKPQSMPAVDIDRSKFFAFLRSGKAPMFGTSLSSGQVKGIEGILDGFTRTGDGRDKTLAYGLATARREVGAGMVPVGAVILRGGGLRSRQLPNWVEIGPSEKARSTFGPSDG
ncbi:peptidoglycan-binding protein [Bosea sp. RAF48]|uniref:peptidoglycan-binding domain-containing protein n=1 Tax=Bosea sp. RAF48 TaxID=3237480 RepID=UPI003F8DE0ED